MSTLRNIWGWGLKVLGSGLSVLYFLTGWLGAFTSKTSDPLGLSPKTQTCRFGRLRRLCQRVTRPAPRSSVDHRTSGLGGLGVRA